MIPPPEDVEDRDHWRTALDSYLAKRERLALLRAELAAARRAGKEARHAARLRRTQRRNR